MRAAGGMLLRGFRRTCRVVEIGLGRALRVVALVVCYLLVGWFLGFDGMRTLHLLRGDDNQ